MFHFPMNPPVLPTAMGIRRREAKSPLAKNDVIYSANDFFD